MFSRHEWLIMMKTKYFLGMLEDKMSVVMHVRGTMPRWNQIIVQWVRTWYVTLKQRHAV